MDLLCRWRKGVRILAKRPLTLGAILFVLLVPGASLGEALLPFVVDVGTMSLLDLMYFLPG